MNKKSIGNVVASSHLELPVSVDLGSGLHLHVKDSGGAFAGRSLQFALQTNGKTWAQGELHLTATPATFVLRPSFGGLSILAENQDSRIALRFIPTPDVGGVQVLERVHGPVARWEWRFPGTTVYTHKQLSVISTPVEQARFRMGGFTQYGQLFDVKDWAVIQYGEMCAGLVSVGVGKWSHPTLAALHGRGASGELTLDMRWKEPAKYFPPGKTAVKRSYLLVHAPAKEVITPTRLGIEYFEPPEGFASWPAAVIARHGTARPERIKALQRTIDSIDWKRPAEFMFGDDAVLHRALDRAKPDPRFGSQPLWAGEIDEARQHLFGEMEKLQKAVHGWAFLHPWGNAVAIRPFAPFCITFHILDYLGHLSDTERKRGAELITDVAELFLRTDFYPHDYATHPPEYPYGQDSFYRGMLNQNFNTDCYVLVGLAGCALRQHPRAKLWRRHAVEQFESQMRAYVWPGGAWEESHTYANHVKLTLLPFVWAMRFMPEKLDLMADPRFRETCRFFPRLLSPPDVMAEGYRAVPAVGDHGYLHGNAWNVFGWLATICDSAGDADHDLYLWAWETTGKRLADSSEFARVMNPLLLPQTSAPLSAPELPRLLELPGYGAAFRGGAIGGSDETLLVVRCGLSWGHYHPDQGSFWWWAHGRLLCCDADLGSGELKFAHRGSSLLAYPDREPLQHLDRPNYHVDRCEPRPGGGAVIRCQVPIVAWGPAAKEIRIAQDQRPHDVRYYEYGGQDHLTIIDEPTKSPEGLVLWCLHVPAARATREGEQRVIFELDDAGSTLRVELPTQPRGVEIKQFGATISVFCTYAQQRLVHEIHFQSRGR